MLIGFDSYDYGLSRSYYGPHIGFNLNSEKVLVEVFYNGTEYGKKTFNIFEPIEINDEIYLPLEIFDLPYEDGECWEHHKL